MNPGPVKINSSRFASHLIELQVESETGGWIVVAQTFYDNWRPYLDDWPQELWKANYGFQAVEIPAGKHAVKIVYEDRLFLAGAIMSGVAWLGCMIACLYLSRRPLELQASAAAMQ